MMKHKKLLTAAAAAVMLLSFGATTAFASDTWQERWCTDANGDGICDHAASSCPVCGCQRRRGLRPLRPDLPGHRLAGCRRGRRL